MTSTIIKGHFYVYFNLNLRCYGQLFVLVLHIIQSTYRTKESMDRLVLGCEFVSEHSMLIENVKSSRIISLIGKKHRGCLFLSLHIYSISYFGRRRSHTENPKLKDRNPVLATEIYTYMRF